MAPRKRSKREPTLAEVQAKFYARLKREGFEDIEDTSNPDRPLKEWHSRKFTSERSRIRQEQREKYNALIDSFINSSQIGEICRLMVKHGNSVLTPAKVREVLEMHGEGISERKIARQVKCSKFAVHSILVKIREWMKVV